MNVLDRTPQRLAASEERGSRVVLLRPRPLCRDLPALLDWRVYLLAPKRLRLDDFGSFCWRQVDGERDVWEIARLMRAEFGERCEPPKSASGVS